MDENWLASLNFRAGNTSAWAGCDARISRSYVEMLAENGRNTGYGYGVFNEDVVWIGAFVKTGDRWKNEH